MRYEITEGSATISGTELIFEEAGSVTVAAYQDGDEEYAAAEPVSHGFCVNPDKPVISTADGATPIEGVTLVSSSSAGNQWYREGELLEGATADTYIAAEAGLYTVKVVAGECFSPIAEGVEIFEVTGVADAYGNEPLKLFPNPTLDKLNIVFESAKKTEDVTVYVLDIRGREVIVSHSIAVHSGEKVVEMDLSDLAPGVYGVFINDGEKLSTAKVLKKKFAFSS